MKTAIRPIMASAALALVASIAPVQARAGSGSGGEAETMMGALPPGTGSMIMGYSDTSMPLVDEVTFVSGMNWLGGGLARVIGSYNGAITQALGKNTVMLKAIAEKIGATNFKLNVQKMKTQSTIDSYRDFSKNSRPINACATVESAGVLRVGEATANKVARQTDKVVSTYQDGWANHTSHQRVIEKLPAQAFDSGVAFEPKQGDSGSGDMQTSALSPAQYGMAARAMAIQTNPEPGITLAPGAATKSKDAAAYKALLNEKRGALALPQQVITGVLKNRLATADGADQANKIWHQMGNKGNFPGIVNGKISIDGYYNEQAAARFENPSWQADINGEGKTALLREIAQMDAAKLSLANTDHHLLEKIAMLLSYMRASQVNRDFGKKIDQAESTIPAGLVSQGGSN